LDQRQGQHLGVAKGLTQLLVLDLGKGRVHHQDKADGDRDVGGAHLELVDEILDAGHQVAQPHANRHGQKDPQCQITVEQRQPFDDASSAGRCSYF